MQYKYMLLKANKKLKCNSKTCINNPKEKDHSNGRGNKSSLKEKFPPNVLVSFFFFLVSFRILEKEHFIYETKINNNKEKRI